MEHSETYVSGKLKLGGAHYSPEPSKIDNSQQMKLNSLIKAVKPFHISFNLVLLVGLLCTC
ncbi:hypothetical protein VCRA2123E131_40253 [Vibrio crassostreae]|nr:hypothetical protein VCRA2126E132_40085 [Vibrio crassostreae]CAK3907212.1 hypothetical protein VCRA2123E131_40253 [Vibrio crassostreae]